MVTKQESLSTKLGVAFQGTLILEATANCHAIDCYTMLTGSYHQTPNNNLSNGCLVKQPFNQAKIWNRPISTTISKWMFQVPG